MPDNTTSPLPDDRASGPPPRPALSDVFALVVVWSAEQPWRAGEVALLRGEGPWTIGRGTDPISPPRVPFIRQRPGTGIDGGPLEGEFISRRQIELRPTTKGLAIANVGNQHMLVDGRFTRQAVVRAGQLVELEKSYVLLVTRRPILMPGPAASPDHAFGEPDAAGIAGEALATWKLRADLEFAAHSTVHVLLRGESGTGKELLARAIHARSARGHGPFVARNAATLPPGVIDAELFGHRRDFPNKGMPEYAGLVGAADGGTLLLDEIAELPVDLQAHLLRVLDADGAYQRVGENRERCSHFRLVGATNRPAGLKHDLAARMRVTIDVPPLHARPEDVLLLARLLVLEHARKSPRTAERFVRRTGVRDEIAMTAQLARALVAHAYTTHVRELDALLLHVMRETPGDVLDLTDALDPARVAKKDVEDLIAGYDRAPNRENGKDAAAGDEGAQLAEAQVRGALEASGWHYARAAEMLAVSRFALRRLRKKYGITPPPGVVPAPED